MLKLLRFCLVVALAAVGLAWAAPAAAQDGIVIPEGTPITLGEPVQASLTAETPIVSFTLDGQAGQPIGIQVEDANDIARYILIADAEGELIFEASFDPIFEYTAHIPLFFLPDDGSYTIAVTGGDYYIYQESEEVTDFTITVITPEFQPIAYGDTVEDTLTPDALYDMYVFEVEEGDIPYAVLDSADQAMLEIHSLTNPEFDELSGNIPPDDTKSYISPRIMIHDDLFMILVYEGILFEDEAYTLELHEYEPAVLTAGTPVEIELKVETLTNYVVFEGAEDQVISLRVDAADAINPTVALIDPDSDVIAVAEDGDQISEVELKEDGQYVVVIFPGEFLVTLENLGTVKVSLVVEE